MDPYKLCLSDIITIAMLYFYVDIGKFTAWILPNESIYSPFSALLYFHEFQLGTLFELADVTYTDCCLNLFWFFSFFRLQSQHFYCSLVDRVKSILLEQSYKRQNPSTAPHREDCESFLRAMCSRSQVRALGVLLSKRTLINTHTQKHSSHRWEEGRRRWKGEERSREEARSDLSLASQLRVR